jgi:hypothetical protein
MKTAEEIAEQAIAKFEDEEAGTDTSVVEDDKKVDDTKDTKDDKQTDDTKDKSTVDTKSDDDKGKTDDKTDDTKDTPEFTADDALEVVEDAKPIGAAPTSSSGVVLSPAEQKYIADNIAQIGEPVVFVGKLGDKAVSYKVYDVNQLPSDFQPDSVVAFQQGVSRINSMNQTAERMINDFRGQQSQAATADFDKRENEGIRQDVAELQKEGDFPKFKVQPGQKGFDDDPAAKQMAEVLDIMTKRNDQYLKEYQQGRPYRHIGFREAFDIQAKAQPAKDQDKAQKQEDKERKQVADRVGSNRGLTASKLEKPRVTSGVTVSDILNKYEHEEW